MTLRAFLMSLQRLLHFCVGIVQFKPFDNEVFLHRFPSHVFLD